MKRIVIAVVLLVLVTVALMTSPNMHASAVRTLTVFAASSLTNAFDALGTAFETEKPEINVLFNFAGSSDLAAQIAEGAPADVFASANDDQMCAAWAAGHIVGAPRVFARNRLALIVPADNPAQITTLRDLANPGVQLLVAAPAVPVRTYTDVMLERLAANPAFGDAFRAAVLANVVSEEQNVRQVSAKIALGEADAGIVYVSDITPDLREQVKAIPIPDALNAVAAFSIGITNNTPNPDDARAFVSFVLSDAGQAALGAWQFLPVRAPDCPSWVPTCRATQLTANTVWCGPQR